MSDNQEIIPWVNKLSIMETVSRFALHADNREWEELQRLFTEDVQLDYTSLTGGEPATIPAKVLMDSWRTALTPLKTQHLISNHVIDFENEQQATCHAYFQAQHELPNPFGGSQWTLGGKYRFRLVKQEAHWIIAELTMTAVWAAGNQNIMNLGK
ncbi:nuclear transport factor 2 family protein [Gorillibacterium sp. sgz5001074]|uniref:nuclear transport factor 2 family protein n=1 Tax=Gorillibacterium sp. sgz5001074 TaxID=3446695 RepID=UPI003F6733BA